MRRSAPIAILLVLALNGCGLGTEIGNGFKSDGGSGASPAKKNSTAAGGASPSKAETNQAQETGDTGAQAGAGRSPNTPADAASVAVPLFIPQTLTASCASPFANIPHRSLVLNETGASNAAVTRLKAAWVAATGKIPAHWDLSDAKDAFVATIRLDPPMPASVLSVMVFDAAVNPLADSYTCGTPRMDDANATYTVPLLKDGAPSTTLSWKIADGKLSYIKVSGITLIPEE